MINPIQLKEFIIIPTLEYLSEYRANLKSDGAINLLLGTCAMESDMGTYIHQVGGGPALGIYQMEPNTHDDLWKNYIRYRYHLGELMDKFKSNLYVGHCAKELTSNFMYATAMARIHYYRSPEPLPEDPNDIVGLAKVWKKVYNTYLGAHSIEHAVKLFCKKYEQYVVESN